jgi:hypothetical protein
MWLKLIRQGMYGALAGQTHHGRIASLHRAHAGIRQHQCSVVFSRQGLQGRFAFHARVKANTSGSSP